jgi:hypothetical protein
MSDLTLYDRNCREKEAQLLSSFGAPGTPIDEPLTEAEQRQVVHEYGVIKNRPPRRLTKAEAGLVVLWAFLGALVVFVLWFQAAFLPVGGR